MRFKDKFYGFFATFLIGKIAFAPGTFGSLLAVFLWYLINYLFWQISNNLLANILLWSILILITFFIGIKAADYYCNKHNKKDAKEVIIDEICGQWIALLIIYFASGAIGYKQQEFSLLQIFYLSSAFILFRVFDILKPWLVGKIDRNVKGGLGVMLDDVVAGLLAGVVFILLKILIVGFV